MTNEDKVKKIIAEQLAMDVDEVSAISLIGDDLGADSLDVIELIVQFEEEFYIEIPDEDVEKIKTVKDAIDYINARAK